MRDTVMKRTNQGRLLNRDLLLLWQGQTVSQLGIQAYNVALLLWIKHATGSATLIGLMLMTAGLAGALLGPIAGTFADRHSRRKIIVASNVMLGVGAVAMGGLMYAMPAATNLILAGLFAVAVLGAAVGAFLGPAISAAIPDLVPTDKLSGANSLFQSSIQLSTFFGQGLGGVLFRLLGAPLLILANGVCYLVASASASFVTIPQPIPARRSAWRVQLAEFKKDLLDGFRHVLRRPGLRNLVLVSAGLNFFTVPVMILLPFYVEDFLGVRADWYGFILAAYGAGSLVGYLAAGAVRSSGRPRLAAMMVCLFTGGAGYVVLGLTRSAELTLAVSALGGVAAGFFIVNLTSILQVTTPCEIRGRVFALLATISGSLAPIAMGLTGVVADLVNRDVPLIYLACGAATLALCALAAISRDLRAYLTLDGEGGAPALGRGDGAAGFNPAIAAAPPEVR
jgi:DHA3 family macrolide efflux protein-like MFS transporter